jgi:predicted GNAT family N-acyltransferase
MNLIIKNQIMGLKQIEHGSKEYDQIVALRYSILREPLGLTYDKEDLDKEKDHVHIAAFEDEELLGCCMLSRVDENTMQLRQMAVKNNQQRKGIGASLISFAEKISKDKGCRKIMMHARDSAVFFYEKCGYTVQGAQFSEVNLPHHIMAKNI